MNVQNLENIRDGTVRLFMEYGNEIAVVLGVSAILFIVIYPFVRGRWQRGDWLAYSPRLRGRYMRSQRKKYVKEVMTARWVSDVEDAVGGGEITRSEATELYRELKNLFPIRALFPSPTALKENIKRRLGNHTKPKLPDGKPKLRHAFDKGLKNA